jgi:hypothetical protein
MNGGGGVLRVPFCAFVVLNEAGNGLDVINLRTFFLLIWCGFDLYR